MKTPPTWVQTHLRFSNLDLIKLQSASASQSLTACKGLPAVKWNFTNSFSSCKVLMQVKVKMRVKV